MCSASKKREIDLSSGSSSRDLSPDVEVQNAFSNFAQRDSPGTENRSLPVSVSSDYQSRASSRSDSVQGNVTPKFLEFWQDGSRRSAFSPYTRPTTVLTNLQRGNIKTQTPSIPSERSIYQLAAQGELFPNEKEDLDEPDANGFTPLMWASSYGQMATVVMLLERKVDHDKTGSNGENSLLLASCHGHSDILKLLVKQGMNVNHTDKSKNTALLYAALNNHALCAEELLKHGADVTSENAQGDTAYSVAVAKGNKQVQAVLEKHMVILLEDQ